MSIVIPGQILKISTRADGTLSVHFNTQELDSTHEGILLSMRNKFVKVYITEKGVVKNVMDAIDSVEIPDTSKKQTMSQKLRHVLWGKWMRDGEIGDFNDFYQKEMEEIIRKVL